MTDKRMIFFIIKKLFFYSFKLKIKQTFRQKIIKIIKLFVYKHI